MTRPQDSHGEPEGPASGPAARAGAPAPVPAAKTANAKFEGHLNGRGRVSDPTANRKRELARIHILKAELKLDREQYENVLWTIGRKESSADLDEHGRRAVIAHLQTHVANGARAALRADPERPHNLDARPQLGKIEAQLAAAGRRWNYARAIAERMHHKRIEFCSSDELSALIAALAIDAKRHGRRAR